MRILTLCATSFLIHGLAAAAPGWLPGFHQDGVGHEINDLERSGPYLYVSGAFESIGPIQAQNVARLGPDGWEAMGSLSCTVVPHLEAVADGPVYAACDSKVYRWNGGGWTPLQLPDEGGPVDDIAEMAAVGQDLFYTRGFSKDLWRRQGDTAVSLVASVQGSISFLGEVEGELVIGGRFTSVGDVPAVNIARYSSGAWQGFAEGVPGYVKALAVFAGALYAGGEFGLMRWDGERWHAENPGVTGAYAVFAMTAGDSALYAGLYPASEGKALARLQAGTWSLHGADFMKGMVEFYALALYEGSLWFGGRIINPRNPGIEHLGAWDGTSFRAPSPSGRAPAGRVRSLALDSRGGLLAGGTFNIAGGGEGFSLVARQTGTGWEEAGPQINGEIYTLERPRLVAAGPEGLYIAGTGVTGGSEYTSGVQHFDGQAWKPLTGVLAGDSLLALQPYSGGLYAGGNFMELDTTPARMLARWDGRKWSSLGTGANGAVRALMLSGDDLLAAGDFTGIGGVPARVGRWSGGRWTRLDEAAGTDGLENGSVHALETWEGMVVAGGDFTVAGGLSAGGIAAWDGERWKTFGKGFQGKVLALEVCQGKLYAGGQFTLTATGTRVNGIARWNGTAWEPLGQGLFGSWIQNGETLAGTVRQILALGPELWVTGDFVAADSYPSAHLAVWSTGETPHSIQAGRRGAARERLAGRFLDLRGMPRGTGAAGMRIFDLGGRRLPSGPGGAAGSGWRVFSR
jgi:hypothetical protein